MRPPGDSPGAPDAPDRRPPEAEEEAAWAEVLSRWEDEVAHLRYLAGLDDLEGLARAGRRYRARLAERPDDPVARSWRDEILKRAAARGLAQLPRTRPPREAPPGVRRAVAAVLVVAAAGVLLWMTARLLGTRGAP